MSSLAFEITPDDVINVMNQMGRKVSMTQALDILGDLDLDEVEEAALSADDMDDQTDYAYANMKEQMEAMDLPL